MYLPNEKELNELDMSGILSRMPENETEWRDYVNSPAGREHYRLLNWFSSLIKNEELVEIGVYKGCSGLALSQNVSNKVTGFDLLNNVTCSMPSNYNLIIDDYRSYPDKIKKASLILYDTNHDGVLETQFINFIKEIKYKGMILFDDIFLNDEMINFWKEMNCNFPCMNLTKLGHCTGTGIAWV